MKELEERELQPEDYELLLTLDKKNQNLPLHTYLAKSYLKAFREDVQDCSQCVFCKNETDIRNQGVKLPCQHTVHNTCLEDIFRLSKNCCPACEKAILEGYSFGLDQKKEEKKDKNLKPKKQPNEEEKQRIILEVMQRNQEAQFGLTGSAIGLQSNF